MWIHFSNKSIIFMDLSSPQYYLFQYNCYHLLKIIRYNFTQLKHELDKTPDPIRLLIDFFDEIHFPRRPDPNK